MNPRLLLFDIDGTLIHSHRIGTRSMLDAIAEVHGVEIDLDGYSMAGRTDLQIFRELLERAGIESDEELAGRLTRRYLDRLESGLAAKPPSGFPGVVALLEQLAEHEEAHLGLVTGNLEEGAHIKLRAADMDRFFLVGAYGSDHANRDRLPDIAIERARAHFGNDYQPEHIVVIGDTPSDIRCARAAGVRALAVATGPFDEAALLQHRPDLVVANCEDVQALVQWMFDD